LQVFDPISPPEQAQTSVAPGVQTGVLQLPHDP
jgi:hypothetical protein